MTWHTNTTGGPSDRPREQHESHRFEARMGENRVPVVGSQICAICREPFIKHKTTWPRVPRADLALGEPLSATGILRAVTTVDKDDLDLPPGRARIVLEIELDD